MPFSAQSIECSRAGSLFPGICAIRLLASQNFCASEPSPLTTPFVAQNAARGQMRAEISLSSIQSVKNSGWFGAMKVALPCAADGGEFCLLAFREVDGADVADAAQAGETFEHDGPVDRRHRADEPIARRGRNEGVEPAQAVSLTLAGNGARRGLMTLPFLTFTRRNTATICSRLHATAPSFSARTRSRPVMS